MERGVERTTQTGIHDAASGWVYPPGPHPAAPLREEVEEEAGEVEEEEDPVTE